MDIIVAEIDLNTNYLRVSPLRPIVLYINGEQVYVRGHEILSVVISKKILMKKNSGKKVFRSQKEILFTCSPMAILINLEVRWEEIQDGPAEEAAKRYS